jgi:hypothetical protein
VDPRAGLDDLEKRKFLTLPGLELQPYGSPSRSQSDWLLCKARFFLPLAPTLGLVPISERMADFSVS